jgi:GNAT superfamily N-acetyltransferase
MILNMEIHITRTNSEDPDFVNLVQQLDADLAIRDGEEHAFYDQFNKITALKHVVVVRENGIPVGCGAIKEFAPDTMEVKRMYTSPKFRGKGIATKVLNELEHWANELSYEQCILETGRNQPEAIGLYIKNGYGLFPNYGQYKGVENSLCFKKGLLKYQKNDS